MTKAVIIGMRNLVYALLTNDPAAGSGQATYEAPKLISGAIDATVNPNSSNATLFADDGPYEVATTIGNVAVDFTAADIPLDVQAELLGHTIVGGRLSRKATDVPPFVALGYKNLKSNGKYRYTWLAKGKFGVPEQQNKTKEGSINFQTPKISGNFVVRECDGEWQAHIDEDHVDYVPSMGANWFNDPYGGSHDSTPPTVSTVAPADAATAVADNTTIVWTFSEPLALSTVNTGTFLVIDQTSKLSVAGTLSINATRDTVTFTPTAALAAATTFETLVTPGVKDLAGNAIATSHQTTFTTV